MKKITLFLLSIFLFSACNNSSEDSQGLKNQSSEITSNPPLPDNEVHNNNYPDYNSPKLSQWFCTAEEDYKFNLNRQNCNTTNLLDLSTYQRNDYPYTAKEFNEMKKNTSFLKKIPSQIYPTINSDEEEVLEKVNKKKGNYFDAAKASYDAFDFVLDPEKPFDFKPEPDEKDIVPVALYFREYSGDTPREEHLFRFLGSANLKNSGDKVYIITRVYFSTGSLRYEEYFLFKKNQTGNLEIVAPVGYIPTTSPEKKS